MSKKVYTGADIEALLKAGKSAADIPAGAVLTPSAKDILRDGLGNVRAGGRIPRAKLPPGRSCLTTNTTGRPARIRRPRRKSRHSSIPRRSSPSNTAWWTSGKRMWTRNYTDGNGGNLTIRVGDNLVLCTPTLVSKGFMTMEQMCLVDMDGKQLAGKYKRTSECMTHLAIMKRQPKCKACCHAHPPHGTAFAVAGVRPPTCMIPEADVFLGEIGLAEYGTPGTPEVADNVGRIGVDHMAVLMVNHGVITWGKDVEDAYWKMENVESLCQTVWVASQLNRRQAAKHDRQPGQGTHRGAQIAGHG